MIQVEIELFGKLVETIEVPDDFTVKQIDEKVAETILDSTEWDYA